MKRRIERDITIVDMGAKGAVIGKKDGQAYLCKGAVPGDIVTLEVRKNARACSKGR